MQNQTRELLSQKQPRRLWSGKEPFTMGLLLFACRSVVGTLVPAVSRLVIFPGTAPLLPYHLAPAGRAGPAIGSRQESGELARCPGEQPLAGGGVGRSGKEEASHSWAAAQGTRNDRPERGRPQSDQNLRLPQLGG